MRDLIVACGDKPRHMYFAARLAEAFPDCGIITESFGTEMEKNRIKEPSKKIREHFAEFSRTEKKFFAGYLDEKKDLIEKHILAKIKGGEINSSETLELLKKENPKFITTYSTAIIKPRMISAFPKRWINLHAGLSPYYRGSGTNLYPILNKEPEYIGMTVHYLDAGIDTGEIILQGRPEFSEKDNSHTIGCKTTVVGADLMIRVIKRMLAEGTCPSVKQDKSRGKLYLKKDFSEEAVDNIRKLISQGLIAGYAKNPKNIGIVEW
ncbi:MAG: hypothetical protein JW772_02855 [Candidatus Diapherotrites archaeon]|nr:hypothetical protein [Candidatus Diapherotrites archaeon]